MRNRRSRGRGKLVLLQHRDGRPAAAAAVGTAAGCFIEQLADKDSVSA